MKYKFTGLSKKVGNVWVNQIEALKYITTPFGTIFPGQRGGWIECEYNLDQNGNCWVTEDAVVSGSKSKIFGDAVIANFAQVTDNSHIFGSSIVRDNARISNGRVYDSIIGGKASLYGDGKLTVENSFIDGSAHIGFNALIVRGKIYNASQVTTFATGGVMTTMYISKTDEVWLTCATYTGPYSEFVGKEPEYIKPYTEVLAAMATALLAL